MKASLGDKIEYRENYSPELLVAISRSIARDKLGFGEELPFVGTDLWNCYELTWLNEEGKPITAAAQISYSALSPCLIESKSLKLYLMSFAAERFESPTKVASLIGEDLSRLIEDRVLCRVFSLQDWWPLDDSGDKANLIDGLTVSCDEYQRNPKVLSAAGPVTRERLRSDLLRALCPVTGQPDYATVFIEYEGSKIQPESVVRYLASLRQHCGFHEECCEMIFKDIFDICRPIQLLVACNFTRRGGIDINPIRKSTGCSFDYEFARTARQ